MDDEEVVRLRALYTRALVNGCKDIRLINAEELKSIEPHCVVSECVGVWCVVSGWCVVWVWV